MRFERFSLSYAQLDVHPRFSLVLTVHIVIGRAFWVESLSNMLNLIQSKKVGELLSTDQHRSPYHTYMTVAHFLLTQRANVAHTGVTHLHWSFSVDKDVFSLQYTLPLVLATTPRLVYLKARGTHLQSRKR